MKGQPGNRRFAHTLLAALVLTIPACGIVSDNPLSDPQKAKVDEELLGTWQNTNPDPQAYCEAVTVEKLSLPGYPPGAMKLTLKPRNPSSGSLIFVCFSTELKGNRFVYYCCGPLLPWDKLRAEGYAIYKYKISGERLTLWGERGVALAQAVEAGKLKGKWAGGQYYSYIQLTDTTERLAAFLSSDEGDAVFGYQEGILKRVK
jgi:hypothetical protein